MNRRNLLCATAMTAVGVVMSPSHTLGQQQSLKERLSVRQDRGRRGNDERNAMTA
jgi:hypothetical protein